MFQWVQAAPLFAIPLFPPVTPAYSEVLKAHPYFLLSNWAWYEWLGIIGPFAVLAWFKYLGRSDEEFGPMGRACQGLVYFELCFLAAGLLVGMPGPLERYSEIQPMRCLHLLYCLMVLFGGGLAGKFLLRDRPLRTALLFVPLCAGMFYAQRQLYPATAHLELPGAPISNPWLLAFDWIRRFTPASAYFALNPHYSKKAGEDEHGFRVLAERSMLADAGKDSGAVSMFPALAARWREQMAAQAGWDRFQSADFARLKRQEGVDWVVIERPAVAGLSCPYQNELLLVCRID
jgi:hypothetical protein